MLDWRWGKKSMWFLGDCSEFLKQICWEAQNYSEMFNCDLKDLETKLCFLHFFLQFYPSLKKERFSFRHILFVLQEKIQAL